MSGDQHHVLDNAVWHALNGAHRHLAEGEGAARRYHPDVSVFYATADNSVDSWDALAELSQGNMVVLFRAGPIATPDDWREHFASDGEQFVFTRDTADVPPLPTTDAATGAAVTLRALTTDDVDEMTALVALTEPGPWRPRTIELGGYVGIFHDDRLVAMAGQRMRPPGHCEISAVCSHPDVRRRGYASLLTLHVARSILERGERPFLHIAASNTAAKAVYEGIGFEVRRRTPFAAITAPRRLADQPAG